MRVSPLSMAQFVRDTWGRYDPVVIAQLSELAGDRCYQQKFYKAPAVGQELMAARSNVRYGLKVAPGSLLYGVYLPCDPTTNAPLSFSLQITDQALKHKFWSEAIPSFFVANSLATSMANAVPQVGTFPSLFNSPWPVTGDGLFLIELWETSGSQQRIELVLGGLEVVDGSKPGVVPSGDRDWYAVATGKRAA
jgi:hypothetical protein